MREEAALSWFQERGDIISLSNQHINPLSTHDGENMETYIRNFRKVSIFMLFYIPIWKYFSKISMDYDFIISINSYKSDHWFFIIEIYKFLYTQNS